MDDLVAFLRARLDEVAEAAAAADDGPWWVEDTSPRRWGDERDAEVACSQGTVAVLSYDRSGDVNAEHVARHDPARVLREVAAKRNLVDSAASARHDRDYWNAQPPTDSKELLKTVAAMEARWSAWHYVLTQLAASYADHPDYRPELIVPE